MALYNYLYNHYFNNYKCHFFVLAVSGKPAFCDTDKLIIGFYTARTYDLPDHNIYKTNCGVNLVTS